MATNAGEFDESEDAYDLTGKIIVSGLSPQFIGSYSVVYRGMYGEERVAVKIIKSVGALSTMRRKVRRERMVWEALRHPNILPFYGHADDEAFEPFGAFISPWYSNGDSGRFLEERGQSLHVAERFHLWLGVVNAVAFLHTHSPLIVHGDLKPGNILIDDNGAPRICDFGLVRILQEGGTGGMTTTTEHTGTERYLAPELVTSNLALPTTATDVYAMGCIGLEFVYLERPYAYHMNNHRGCIITDIRAGIPPATSQSVQSVAPYPSWNVIEPCWAIDPERRPSAFQILQFLHTVNLATHNTSAEGSADEPVTLEQEQKVREGSIEPTGAHAGPGNTSPEEPREEPSTPPSTLASRSSQGNYSVVDVLEQEALEQQGWLLGQDSSETIQAAANLAQVHSAQGRWNEAERMWSEVLEKRVKTLGAEHLDTINAADHLAITYHVQGRWNEVEKLWLNVLAKRTRIQGAEHLDTINTSHSLAATYHDQGRWNEAEMLWLDVLEKRMRTQGAEHLDTIKAAHNLAATYHAQGRWNKAEKLQLDVLEKRVKTLGAEHLDTINAADHLAITYHVQGRWNEAEKLWLDVLEKRTRIQGAEHPDTIRAAHKLAATYRAQGKKEEARKVESSRSR